MGLPRVQRSSSLGKTSGRTTMSERNNRLCVIQQSHRKHTAVHTSILISLLCWSTHGSQLSAKQMHQAHSNPNPNSNASSLRPTQTQALFNPPKPKLSSTHPNPSSLQPTQTPSSLQPTQTQALFNPPKPKLSSTHPNPSSLQPTQNASSL